MKSKPLHIMIAAGGTGGHVYPAIAIADALKKQDKDLTIAFAGTRSRMEWTAVPDAGYDIYSIWISGIHRYLTLKNLMFPLRLMVAAIQSISLLKTQKPDAVISCGGFAAGPVGWAAGVLGIPLFVQEQNSFPGLTNRKLANKARHVYTAFDDAAEYFDTEKVRNFGNPIRSLIQSSDKKESLAYFHLKPTKKTLLIIGGSGGAKSINDAMVANVERLHNELDLQIIWQTGPNYYDEIRQKVPVKSLPNLRMEAFLDKMYFAYGASDLALSRAGAISCAELMLLGKPSIMIPSPNVAGDHQRKNARSMVKMGAAILVEDKSATENLYDAVAHVIADDEKLSEMSQAALSLAKPDAAERIAKDILTQVHEIRGTGP